MTAAKLRSLPTDFPATADVRFVTEDGRRLAFVRAERIPAPRTPETDGAASKYTGEPTLVIVLRDQSLPRS